MSQLPLPPLEPTDPPPPRRPAKLWVILLIAWAVGLCVWVFYLLVFAIVLYRLA